MSNFKKVDFPNSRLLYKDVNGLPSSWNSIRYQLEEVIRRNPQLSMARQGIFIYFFDDPKNFDLQDLECRVGLEIIGFHQADGSDLEVEDFQNGPGMNLKTPLEVNDFKYFTDNIFFWNQLEDLIKEAREQADLASTWRLRLLAPQNKSDCWSVDMELFAVL